MKVLGKAFYLISGVVFTLIGSAMFAGSYYIYNKPVQEVSYERVKKASINSCAQEFNGPATYMNMDIEKRGESIYVKAFGINEWEGKINMASHIISQCPSMSLKKLCFGESCNIAALTGDKRKPFRHEGMFMELHYSDNNIDPRVNKSWE